MPAQYHDNVDRIENSLEEWNRQDNINTIRDFLRILWNNVYSANDMLAKLRSIIIKKEY